MSDERNLNLDIMEVVDAKVRKGVEIERQRCGALVTEVKTVAAQNADYVLTAALRDCLAAILSPKSKPAPPPDKPIALLIHLTDERNLDEAKRIGDAILKSVGLK